MCTQLLLLREFLTVFAGNELVIGVVLAIWLLGIGLGAAAGRLIAPGRQTLWLLGLLVLLGALPIAQLTALRELKLLLVPGTVAGLDQLLWTGVLVIGPYCAAAGALFTIAARQLSADTDPAGIGSAYALDTAGSIGAGLVFAFVLVVLCTPYQIALAMLLLSLLAVAAATGTRRWWLAVAALALFAGALLWCRHADLETQSLQRLYAGQELLWHGHSQAGQLVVTRQAGQLQLYDNGRPLATTGDSVTAEETVHYALSQHPRPAKVLLVGGSFSGAADEILKYPVQRLDLVAASPALMRLALALQAIPADPRAVPIGNDARRFLQTCENRYDAILAALPEPATLQANRFYTVEFFRQVKRGLRPGGVFGFSLGSIENYAGSELRELLSAVDNALREVFPQVLALPAGRVVFIAADLDRGLSYEAPESLAGRGIATDYVRPEYYRAMIAPDRLAMLREALAATSAVNADGRPLANRVFLAHWLSRAGDTYFWPAALALACLLLLLLTVVRQPRPATAAAVGSSGFVVMGLQVVLLLLFQTRVGYLYHYLSVLIAVFMLGAAAGAWYGTRRNRARGVLNTDASLGLVALLTAATCWTDAMPPWSVPASSGILLAAGGFAAGAQFSFAARQCFTSAAATAGALVLLDTLGAALGALLVAVLAAPLLGLGGSCLALAGVKLATASWLALAGDAQTVPAADRVPRPSRLPAFTATVGILVVIAVLLGAEGTMPWAYAASVHRTYRILILVMLGWGFIAAVGFGSVPSWRRPHSGLWHLSVFRWANYLVFGIAVFFPLVRCFFRIPYLFCHVCPRPCIFGVVRPFLIPAALIMNLQRRLWCYHACPVGTLLDCESRAGGGRRYVGWARTVMATVALALVVYVYFRVRTDQAAAAIGATDWYQAVYKNSYSISLAVIVGVGLVLMLTWRYARSFCDLLCPVGAVSETFLRLEQRLGRRPKCPAVPGPTRKPGDECPDTP